MPNRSFVRPISVTVAFLLSVVGLCVALPHSAHAAAISIGNITGQVSNHTGDAGTATQNCIRYSPTAGTGASGTSSAYVPAGSEALTAHGSNPSCPPNLNTSTQSAVGVSPTGTTSVVDGVVFPIGRVTHYNNPIQATAERYTGQLSFNLGGMDAGSSLVNFDWAMWETVNTGTCPFPNGPNANGCADEINFSSAISTDSVVQNGIRYKVVIAGFNPIAAGTSCPTTPNGSPNSNFLTAERSTTAACIYAKLVQIRSLKIVKETAGMPVGMTAPTFGFTSTSGTSGSPWAGATATVNPNSTSTNSVTRDLLQTETVSVTESAPAGDQWALTQIRCLDGAGATVPATYDLAQRGLTIANTPAPATVAAGPITCTYTNTYTPKATLTLIKQVTPAGSAPVTGWTLRADGPTPISGLSGAATVTSQRVNAGTYTLTETGPNGFVQQNLVCSGATVTAGTVVLADGANATCTFTNRQATGNFTVTKTVADPDGGYTGTAATPFTGTYTCGAAAPAAFTVSGGTPYISPQIPAGIACTVTETQPTGNLRDTSYSWTAPSYGAAATVTIADQQTRTVAITNTATRALGQVQISKTVVPEAGTDASGYTGGANREFPVGYTCRIGGTTVASGTTTVTPGDPAVITGIPATSVCSFTETVAMATGDFADDSYSWSGHSFSPQTATVTANQTVATTLTNRFVRHYSTLMLRKVVTGGGYVGTGKPFTVTNRCGSGEQSVELGAGEQVEVSVPANTVCAVAETAPADSLLAPAFDWGTPTYAGLTDGTIAVPVDETATVTVTNPTVAVFGKVAVTKAISPLDLATAVVNGTTFAITLTCDAPAEGDGDDYSATFHLAAGATGSSPQLPVGTECEVSEDAPTVSTGLVDGSYVWGPAPPPQDVTVKTKDGTETVTVTNTIRRAHGDLTITKIVDPLDGVDGSDTTFSGTWTCVYGSDEPVDGTWTRKGSGTATLIGMPAAGLLIGSTCTVTEDTPDPAQPDADDSSYAWIAAEITGPVTLTTADPEAAVKVTNPVSRITGSFGVGKTVVGGEPGEAFAADNFTFTYRCVPAGGGAAISGALAVDAGGVANLPAGVDIPAGSTCTLTEGDNPAPIDPYRWDDAVAFAVTGAVGEADGRTVTFVTPADGDAVAIAVTNSISPISVEMAVRKVVDDPDGGATGAARFPLSLTCDGVAYGPVEVADGGTATFTVPLGADCVPSEGVIPAGSGLADDSFAWGAATISPATVNVAEVDGNYRAVVTNPVVRVRGEIGLIKSLAGPTGVVAGDRPYGGTWSCTYGGEPAGNGTWTVDGAGAATLTGPYDAVLLTADCTATEGELGAVSDTDPSYAWSDPKVTGTTVTAAGPNVLGVANSFGRKTGELTVTKTVTGETAGYVGAAGDSDFVVAYRCSLSDPEVGPFFAGEVAVAAGADAVTLAGDIPQGWTCAVREAVPSNDLLLDSSYGWGIPVITIEGEVTNVVTVSAGSTEVGVTNLINRVRGPLVITKEYHPSSPDGVVATGAVFTGTWNCSYRDGKDGAERFAGTWTRTGAGDAVLDPDIALPLGSSCTATEAAPSDDDLVDVSWTWGKPVISSAQIVDNAAVPAKLIITNSVQRVYGSLSLSKVYVGIDGALSDGLDVAGSWSCAFGEIAVGSGRWSVPAAGGNVGLFDEAAQIPAGADCTVVEDTLSDTDLTDSSYRWAAPIYAPAAEVVGAAITLDRTGDQSVTVTNSTIRLYGTFTINKTVSGTGLPVGLPAGALFVFDYTCAVPGADEPVVGALSLGVDETVAYDGDPLPQGSECAVAENRGELPDLSRGFGWGDLTASVAGIPVVAGDPITVIIAADTTVAIKINNELRRVPGAYSVAKTADPPSGTVKPGDVITYTITVTPDGKGPIDDVIVVDDLSGVRPYATVVEGSIKAGQGAAVLSADDKLTWTVGTVDGDQPIVLTYAYKIDATAVGVTIRNLITSTGEVPGECDPCSTTHDVPTTWMINKSADPPSGTEIQPGDLITYELHASTQSMEKPVSGVVVNDDLSQVLLSADFVGFDDHEGTAVLDGTKIIWTIGELAPGTGVALRYTVRVKADAWDVVLRNVVTGVAGDGEPPAICGPIVGGCSTEHTTPPQPDGPSPTPSVGATTATADPEPTDPADPPGRPTPMVGATVASEPGDPGDPGEDTLSDTGASASSIWLLGLGSAALLIGATLLIFRRRKARRS